MKTIYPAGSNVEHQEYREGRQDQSGAVSNEGQREDRQSDQKDNSNIGGSSGDRQDQNR